MDGNASDSEIPRWRYVPQPPKDPSPVMKSLQSLHSSLPRDEPEKQKFQHTLQTLSEFTGYISSQIYIPMRYAGNSTYTLTSGSAGNTIEDELKKEIRALKGAVLNRYFYFKLNGVEAYPSSRRSFMPTITRAVSST